jgi:hypothetical protein
MKNINDTNNLAARLHREAAESTPSFSPLLHARIMRRVTSPETAGDTTLIDQPQSHRLAFIALAAAASVALLLMLHPWSASTNTTQVTHPSPVVVTQPHLPLPQFVTVIDSVTTPASEQLDNARFAYLDRDAKHLTEFMMRRVDVLPSAR